MPGRNRLAVTEVEDWALINEREPKIGPCLVCGQPGVDQRHRVLDAVAGSLAAGDDPATASEEFGIPVDVVEAVGRVWVVGRDT